MGDPAEIETPELLRRGRDGDRASLQLLLERYRPQLMTRIRLMMGEEARRVADSVDFLQGAFAEVLADLALYELADETAFLRWATRIARNNIRDEVRRRRERALDSFMSDSGLFRSPGSRSGETPSQHLSKEEQLQRLTDALSRLGEEHQTVIELRWFETLPFAEVGRRTGRSEEAARALHARAMVRLGAALKRGAGE